MFVSEVTVGSVKCGERGSINDVAPARSDRQGGNCSATHEHVPGPTDFDIKYDSIDTRFYSLPWPAV